MTDFIRLIRPKEWVKNVLVFAALFFAQHYFNSESWMNAIFAFIAMSLTASSIYVVNDLFDAEFDRIHPVKCNRPIASGRIKRSTAIPFAILLALGGLLLALRINLPVFYLVSGYLITMLLYSLKLKNILLLDVFIIAGGMVARAAIGADAISVEISPWLLVCTFFIALTLALVKRRQELARIGDNNPISRKSLQTAPSLHIWDQWISAVSGITILAYTLYTVDEATVAKVGSTRLMYTVPFVAFAIFRYLVTAFTANHGEDPTDTLLHERSVIVAVFLWLATVIFILTQS